MINKITAAIIAMTATAAQADRPNGSARGYGPINISLVR